MTPRTGRPPVKHPRTVTIRYRLTDAEAQMLNQAASSAGRSVTDYARDKALGAAKRQQ